MRFEVAIHDSWASVPHALSRLLVALAVLEKPRQPGDDGEDLTELLSGMDDPEPQPAPQPSAAPPRPPAPTTATPPDKPSFDGTPRTGKSLYRFGCDHKLLPRINAIGKSFNYPKLVSDWEPSQVAAAYAILTSEPAPNGRVR
jgi:hypothetical protein